MKSLLLAQRKRAAKFRTPNQRLLKMSSVSYIAVFIFFQLYVSQLFYKSSWRLMQKIVKKNLNCIIGKVRKYQPLKSKKGSFAILQTVLIKGAAANFNVSTRLSPLNPARVLESKSLKFSLVNRSKLLVILLFAARLFQTEIQNRIAFQ